MGPERAQILKLGLKLHLTKAKAGEIVYNSVILNNTESLNTYLLIIRYKYNNRFGPIRWPSHHKEQKVHKAG